MRNLIYAYYNNPEMLKRHLKEWKQYPEDIKIILVDDGSQDKASDIIGFTDINIEVYRVLEDIPWNQTGARNLGFTMCDNDFCLATDIDHLIPAKEIKHFINGDYKRGNFYKPLRKKTGDRELREKKKYHCNSFIIHKKDFWKTGGYDEDFAGHYGSDTAFLNILNSQCQENLIDRPCLIAYTKSDIPDATTRKYGRHGSDYSSLLVPELKDKLHSTYKAKNPVRFDWERVI